MDPEGQATVESLARFQQAKSITSAGSLVRYALSRESVTVLQEATGGLYGWQHPGLPDNLCLYRGDGSPWLVSSAGAHIGYLEVSPFEKLLIGRTAPGLIAVLAHQSARDAILAYMERRFEFERVDADRSAHRIRAHRRRRRPRRPRRRPRGLDALRRGSTNLRRPGSRPSTAARRAPRNSRDDAQSGSRRRRPRPRRLPLRPSTKSPLANSPPKTTRTRPKTTLLGARGTRQGLTARSDAKPRTDETPAEAE